MLPSALFKVWQQCPPPFQRVRLLGPCTGFLSEWATAYLKQLWVSLHQVSLWVSLRRPDFSQLLGLQKICFHMQIGHYAETMNSEMHLRESHRDNAASCYIEVSMQVGKWVLIYLRNSSSKTPLTLNRGVAFHGPPVAYYMFSIFWSCHGGQSNELFMACFDPCSYVFLYLLSWLLLTPLQKV